MNEFWKEMKEHKDYEVSSLGNIRNKKTGRILTQTKNNKGYMRFVVYVNKKAKCFYVHRVVANNFLDNPDKLPEINHKNEIKTDNSIGNLEWCDSNYNHTYGTRVQRILETKRKKGIIK